MREPDINVLNRNCGARQVLALIADQWTALVIHVLGPEVRRYSELQRLIPDISPKMLTQTLRKLERDGIIQRTVYPVVPPKTEYRLTALGQSLLEPLRVLCRWAEEHLADVEGARARFEHGQAQSRD